jgi:predicted alpha/beta superfamily hydrolase
MTDSEAALPVRMGQSRSYSFPSRVLGDECRLAVALPAQVEGCATIYVLGAGSAFWLTVGMLRTLLWDSIVPQVVIVGVAPPAPPPGAAAYATTQDFSMHEPIERFLEALRSEVTPFIEQRLPVDPGARTLIGHSMAGLCVVRSLLSGDGHFSGYLASSPALWRLGAARVIEESVSRWQPPRPAKLFLSVGSLEQPDWEPRGALFRNVERLVWFARLLEQQRGDDVSVHSQVLTDEGHTTAMAPGFARGIQWILGRSYPEAAKRWAPVPASLEDWLRRADLPSD